MVWGKTEIDLSTFHIGGKTMTHSSGKMTTCMVLRNFSTEIVWKKNTFCSTVEKKHYKINIRIVMKIGFMEIRLEQNAQKTKQTNNGRPPNHVVLGSANKKR